MSRGAAAGARSVGRSGDEKAASEGAVLCYLEHSQRPLMSLAFVLPMLLIYELATGLWGAYPVEGAPQPVVAFTLMRQFFGLFGATGKYLPALAVIGILAGCHLARRDRVQLRISYLFGMAAESLMLAMPIVAIGYAMDHFIPQRLLAAGVGPESSRNLIAICLGAGIYEELVFRLILMSVLSLMLRDAMGMGSKRSSLLVVAAAAVLFAGYHYLGSEPFHLRTFTFRTLAGMYFGVLFISRGFGITAGSHAAYDLLYVFRIM